jgi:hypothetical protein
LATARAETDEMAGNGYLGSAKLRGHEPKCKHAQEHDHEINQVGFLLTAENPRSLQENSRAIESLPARERPIIGFLGVKAALDLPTKRCFVWAMAAMGAPICVAVRVQGSIVLNYYAGQKLQIVVFLSLKSSQVKFPHSKI